MKNQRTQSTAILLAAAVFGFTVAPLHLRAEDPKIDLSGVKITKSTLADYKKECLSCHGKDGKGKTKAGRRAKVKDLTDAKYQGSFSDGKAFVSIKEGMKNEKGKELMKAYGSKLNDDQIKALIKFCRTFSGKK